MSNQVSVFNKDGFGEVRSIMIDKNPWFIGKDIAEALEYKDTNQAIRKHVDDEDKLTRQIDGSGQNREMVFINESGVYSLILRSRNEKAKEFKHWVTSEVLPSIRKTGAYHLSPAQQISQMREERLRDKLAFEREKEKNRLNKERFAYLRELRNSLEDEYEKRIIFCEMATIAAGRPIIPLETGKTYTAEEIGKRIGISANMVGRIANANNLKTPQYGVYRTSVVNGTERQSFEYYDIVISEIRKHINQN
jgi:hypothetical protein